MVFILGAGRHDGAPLLGAEFGYGAVEHVDLVEEVDRVDRHPLVQVFSLGKNYRKPQVSLVERNENVHLGKRLRLKIKLI